MHYQTRQAMFFKLIVDKLLAHSLTAVQLTKPPAPREAEEGRPHAQHGLRERTLPLFGLYAAQE